MRLWRWARSRPSFWLSLYFIYVPVFAAIFRFLSPQGFVSASVAFEPDLQRPEEVVYRNLIVQRDPFTRTKVIPDQGPLWYFSDKPPAIASRIVRLESCAAGTEKISGCLRPRRGEFS